MRGTTPRSVEPGRIWLGLECNHQGHKCSPRSLLRCHRPMWLVSRMARCKRTGRTRHPVPDDVTGPAAGSRRLNGRIGRPMRIAFSGTNSATLTYPSMAPGHQEPAAPHSSPSRSALVRVRRSYADQLPDLWYTASEPAGASISSPGRQLFATLFIYEAAAAAPGCDV